MPQDEKPSPQVSPGKPGDGPKDEQIHERDRISRSHDDDEHRQPKDD